MKAGRELDVLVAEKVLLLHGVEQHRNGSYYYSPTVPGSGIVMSVRLPLPHFSTDTALIWRLEQGVDELGLGSQYLWFLMGFDSAEGFDSSDVWRAWHGSTPEQRCIAALKACGVDVPADELQPA